MDEKKNMHLPKLIAFDLDDTIWNPEMWLCSRNPFRRVNGKVYCSGGEEMKFLGDSAEILHHLYTHEKWKDTIIVYVSSTSYPEASVPLLSLMEIHPGITMKDVVRMDLNQIYHRNKQVHFSRLKEHTNLDYEDMLFFDNQMDNIEDVSEIGCHCIYTPHGMTHDHWNNGLEKFHAHKEKQLSTSSKKKKKNNNSKRKS